MRSKFALQAVFVFLISTVVLTGCKGTGKKPAPPQAGMPGGVAGTGDGTGIASTELSGRPDDLSGGIRGAFTPVYFEFDSAKVKPAEVTKLESVASKLKGGSSRLVVEGYADERGTPEYNRALGERRALACREELSKLGLDAARVTTVSYGEDKTADPGHDEGAWAKNRRCEFVVLGQ